MACQLGRARPTPEVIIVTPTLVPAAPTLPAEAPTPSGLPILAAGPVIDDFEDCDFEARWWSDVGEGTASFTCAPGQPGHDSAQAMRLTFEIGAASYAACSRDVDPGRWGNARGLSFSWRVDEPGLTVSVGVGMDDAT